MKSNLKILMSIVILAILFIPVYICGLNESDESKKQMVEIHELPGEIPIKNMSSLKKEHLNSIAPPPETDIDPPPGFNGSDMPQKCDAPKIIARNTSKSTSDEPKLAETDINAFSKNNSNETSPTVKTAETTSKNNEQTNNSIGIKWYYLLPLFLIPFLLFFLMSENAVVADAEFLQNVKAESSIFHKFRNIYVTPHIYSEISKQNKNIAINLKTTYLNKKGNFSISCGK